MATPTGFEIRGAAPLDSTALRSARLPRMRRVSVVLTAGAALFAGIEAGAQAQYFPVDLLTPGDAMLTRDVTIGIDWLDLTATEDLSYDEVVAGAGGWASLGFVHADTTETCALLAEWSLAPSACPGFALGGLDNAPAFTALFGQTYESTTRAQAIFEDGGGDPDRQGRFDLHDPFGFPSSIDVAEDVVTNSASSGVRGHLLLRPSTPHPPVDRPVLGSDGRVAAGDGRISRLQLDGAVEPLVSLPGWALLGLTVDAVHGHIYATAVWPLSLGFVQTRSIWRFDLDGSNATMLVDGDAAGLDEPMRIAVDPLGGKLYWTDVGDDALRLQRADLDGTDIETLASGGEYRGLGLDLVRGHVYWSNYTSGTIERARLDGSAHLVLHADAEQPTGLALDVLTRTIYWSGGHATGGLLPGLYRGPMGGAAPAELVLETAGVIGDFATDLDAGHLYWSAAGSLGRASLAESSFEVLFAPWTLKTGIALVPACADGLDNDGDGDIDHPADEQCASPQDDVEAVRILPPTRCGLGSELALVLGWLARRRLVRPARPIRP